MNDAPGGGEDDRDESAAGEHHDPPRDCIDAKYDFTAEVTTA
jgi:hypothetical protein